MCYYSVSIVLVCTMCYYNSIITHTALLYQRTLYNLLIRIKDKKYKLIKNIMGIKGLKKILRTYDLIKPISLESLQGQSMAVDISLLIYQSVAVGNVINKQYSDDREHHIAGLIQKTTTLLQNNITPIFFFDGKPPVEKNFVIEQRKINNKLQVPKGAFDEALDIINLMGLEGIISPSEAEAQAARCVQDGHAYAVMTEDTDTLPLHSKMLIVDKGQYFIIDPVEVLQKLEFTREQFIDFCILLGCDYSRTLPKIGPVTALKHIRKHKSIDNLIASEHINPPAGFDHVNARKHFITPVINPCTPRAIEKPSTVLKDRLLYYKVSEAKINKLLAALDTFHAGKTPKTPN